MACLQGFASNSAFITVPECNTIDSGEANWPFFQFEEAEYKQASHCWTSYGCEWCWISTNSPSTTATRTTVLQAAAHTVYPHDAKQQAEEPAKAFTTRVRGIAASCQLTKTCPDHNCRA